MRNKFEMYWDGSANMNPLVTVASVFDPRNKLQFASLCFDQIYGKGTIESRQLYSNLCSVMKKLYDQYSFRLTKSCEIAASAEPSLMVELLDDEDGCERMDSIYNKMFSLRSNEEISSELDIYLAEKTEIRADNSLHGGRKTAPSSQSYQKWLEMF
ncbi:hypothetical protein V5N11_009982 [Cardamine amara subsp. amara]|uniref:hAT-like transposase RNase-H fold domain-containing protein n=1 Tax=Cardamine amara subsp. amara TaxID=228776 RepID=A0ABD1BD58_CARAN